MASPFDCFKQCFNRFALSDHKIVRRATNPIVLDTSFMGHEVVIIKDGLRACGSGGCLGSAPLVQNKSYFEVKLQQSGIWGCGVASQKTDLNVYPGGQDTESWVLCSDMCIRHNQENIHKLDVTVQEGDVIGIWYDHIELNFSINGKKIDCPVTGIKGIVYPALFVHNGAVLDIIFDEFMSEPPSGFDKIMLEQSLL